MDSGSSRRCCDGAVEAGVLDRQHLVLEHRLDDLVEQRRAVEQGHFSATPQEPELAVDVPEDRSPLRAPDDVAERDPDALLVVRSLEERPQARAEAGGDGRRKRRGRRDGGEVHLDQAPPPVLPLDDARQVERRLHEPVRHGGLDAQAGRERMPVVLAAPEQVRDEQEVAVDAGGAVRFRGHGPARIR